MAYYYALSAPKRFQFEANSGTLFYSQKFNCGPTCATMIAGFYKDRWFGIEATRRLVAPAGRPTYYTEQRDMLAKRGVPASLVNVTSISQLRNLVAGGKRPVILEIYMGRVPASYRDHPFTGWHAVVVMAAPAGGFWINDPNFSPPGGHRPDPDRGKKWWPDWVMKYAFIDNPAQHTVVAPNAPKVVTVAPPTTTTKLVSFNSGTNGVNLRTAVWGPVFAVARSTGIYRASDNLRLSSLTTGFTWLATVKDSAGTPWFKVKGFNQTLYVVAKFMHFR